MIARFKQRSHFGFFSAAGNTPERRLKLIKKVHGAANSSLPSLISGPGRSSGPKAFEGFIFFKTHSTSFVVISLNLNVMFSGLTFVIWVCENENTFHLLLVIVDLSCCRDDPMDMKKEQKALELFFQKLDYRRC